MTYEDLFSNLLKHVNLSGNQNPTRLLASVMRQAERHVLSNLMRRIEAVIGKIDSQSENTQGGARMSSDYTDEQLDPFTILDVDRNATQEEVKKAYWKKSQEVHEDHGGSHADMVRVNAAYEAIKIYKGWI